MNTLLQKFEDFAPTAEIEITESDKKFCQQEYRHVQRFVRHADEAITLLTAMQNELKTKKLTEKGSIPFEYRWKYFDPIDKVKDMKSAQTDVFKTFTKNIADYFKDAYNLDYKPEEIEVAETYEGVVQNIVAKIGCALVEYGVLKLKRQIAEVMSGTASVSISPTVINMSGIEFTRKGKFNEYCGSGSYSDVGKFIAGVTYLVNGSVKASKQIEDAWPGNERIMSWPSTIVFPFAGIRTITSERNSHTIIFNSEESKNRFAELFHIL